MATVSSAFQLRNRPDIISSTSTRAPYTVSKTPILTSELTAFAYWIPKIAYASRHLIRRWRAIASRGRKRALARTRRAGAIVLVDERAVGLKAITVLCSTVPVRKSI